MSTSHHTPCLASRSTLSRCSKALLLAALLPASALAQGTVVLHCNVIGGGGDNASFRGIRFTVDQDFTAVEVHVNGSAAGPVTFDVELRRSMGYVDPVIATASAAENLVGSPGTTPYQAVLIDFGQTITVGGSPETFTLKALNIVGPPAMYWEVAGIGNIPCPDAEVTNENNTATPTMRTSACGLRVLDMNVPGSIGTNYCQSNPNSTGNLGVIGAIGSAVRVDNDVTLQASSLPNNSFGFFLTSQTQAFVANPGGSMGNICLGGSIGRYVGPGQIQNTGGNGSFGLVLDLGQTPTSTGIVSVNAGETWNFQSWHRDSVGGVATSNFTDGLSISFL